MATKHECMNFTSTVDGRDFSIIKTTADNLKLVNLYNTEGALMKLKDTNYYGMNGCYFNSTASKPRYRALLNIAYQDGKDIGCGIELEGSYPGYYDGDVNVSGSSLVYWTGSKLGYASSVPYGSSSSLVPKERNSWALGGFGLYLWDDNWRSKYEDENNAGEYPIDGRGGRAGILFNTYTEEVYLFANKVFTTTVNHLRNGMMEFVEKRCDDTNKSHWKGIMVDGGTSVQIRGDGMNMAATGARDLCCIIALRSKS